MKLFPQITQVMAAGVLSFIAVGASADWRLDESGSAINFISIKKAAVAETHSFDSLKGGISDAGHASVSIELDSVQTLIEVRDERMREMLFETARFPLAEITTQVDTGLLDAQPGQVTQADIEVSVNLHGLQKTMLLPVIITGTADQGLLVSSASPVLVSAGDFDLTGGIARLQEVAGLPSISTAVPVSFRLLFTPGN